MRDILLKIQVHPSLNIGKREKTYTNGGLVDFASGSIRFRGVFQTELISKIKFTFDSSNQFDCSKFGEHGHAFGEIASNLAGITG